MKYNMVNERTSKRTVSNLDINFFTDFTNSDQIDCQSGPSSNLSRHRCLMEIV